MRPSRLPHGAVKFEIGREDSVLEFDTNLTKLMFGVQHKSLSDSDSSNVEFENNYWIWHDSMTKSMKLDSV